MLVLEIASVGATSVWDSIGVGDNVFGTGEEEWGTGNVEGGVTGIGESGINLCDMLAPRLPFPLVAWDLPLPVISVMW